MSLKDTSSQVGSLVCKAPPPPPQRHAMSTIATDKAVEVVMLLVPKKGWGWEQGETKLWKEGARGKAVPDEQEAHRLRRKEHTINRTEQSTQTGVSNRDGC